MEISLKWIDELIDIRTVNLEDLITKLTLGGFEVEDVIEKTTGTQVQITLDVSATANRPDSLAIQGFSSELGALLNKPLRETKYKPNNVMWQKRFDTSAYNLLEDTDCQVFFAISIENVENLTSPKWLQKKLIYSGVTPENDLSDFQKYIQLETGYPFELYDLEKISSNLNSQNSRLSLLKDKKIQKVFFNNKEIGITGISANENSRCSDKTTKILLEGSIFKAATIRQRSRLTGVRTDRSTRYEKSIDQSHLTEACYRFLALLRIKNPKLHCKLHTNSKIQLPNFPNIVVQYDTIRKILGSLQVNKTKVPQYILPEQVSEYLTRLNFKPIYNKSTKNWSITTPNIRRTDIIEEIDVIEEIGRLHGFDNFLTKLPKIKRLGIKDPSYRTRKKLTTSFLSIGLSEFVHYSLTNLQRQNKNTIELINPLLSEYASLRASLLPSLIKTLANNVNQGNTTIEGFEYGHIFEKGAFKAIHEKEVVAGILGGTNLKSTGSTSVKPMNWFEAKGRLDQMCQKLNIKISWKFLRSEDCPSIFHPYRTSQLLLDANINIGIFGQINPILVKKLNLPVSTYLFELDFEQIKRALLKTTMTASKRYSLYPKIIKDLSIIVPKNVTFHKVKQIIYFNGSQFLTEINLVDEYNGANIPDFHTSLCLQLIFQSNKQTLENKQVDHIISNLKLILVNDFGLITR